MRIPLDLGGLEILIAVTLLVVGTIALSLAGALAARAVDRVWDAVGG
jgi:hypothetical protein